MVIAAALVAVIFFLQRQTYDPSSGPASILPGLKPEAVTSVQVRPAAGLTIQADRTNGFWQLAEPQVYPAQALSIERFLAALKRLTPVTFLTAHDLRNHPNPDEEYGFTTPQATITLQQPDYHVVVQVGARTAPGDQVFLQVVGVVYVVDADWLKYIPRGVDDWRDTTFLEPASLAFDRLSITNGSKILELQRTSTNGPWIMTHPLKARADNVKIDDALLKLQSLRIQQFISSDAKLDLESFGLQSPQLELGFSQGTNPVALLQFGKNPTNDDRLIFARRSNQKTIVTVANDLLAPWRDKVYDFRDPHLLALAGSPAVIEVRAQDNFRLEQQTNGAWRVEPQGFPADAELIGDLLAALNSLRVLQFIDAVIEPDLPSYGLAAPARRFTLRTALTNLPSVLTNLIIADLSFGTNQAGQAFARRADESFVYGIATNDFLRLPLVSWQLRDRQIWNVSTNDVDRVIIRQQGKLRQLKRNGPHNWSVITPGTVNDLAVEETVKSLCQLAAGSWVARGEQFRPQFGFTDKGHQITVELKNGQKARLEFGGRAPSGCPYAAVTLDGTLWIFEFPADLYQYVAGCLNIPADVP